MSGNTKNKGREKHWICRLAGFGEKDTSGNTKKSEEKRNLWTWQRAIILLLLSLATAYHLTAPFPIVIKNNALLYGNFTAKYSTFFTEGKLPKEYIIPDNTPSAKVVRIFENKIHNFINYTVLCGFVYVFFFSFLDLILYKYCCCSKKKKKQK